MSRTRRRWLRRALRFVLVTVVVIGTGAAARHFSESPPPYAVVYGDNGSVEFRESGGMSSVDGIHELAVGFHDSCWYLPLAEAECEARFRTRDELKVGSACTIESGEWTSYSILGEDSIVQRGTMTITESTPTRLKGTIVATFRSECHNTLWDISGEFDVPVR